MISIDSLVPRSVADTAAFLFLLLGVFTTFVFETTVVLPFLCPGSWVWYLIHTSAGIFLVHGIIGNLYFLTVTETSIRNQLMPTSLLAGWHFCSVCESNSPVRASHCKVCDVCILKRSHHCIFAGRCIGYKNCRYFVALLMNLFVGTLYAVALNQCFIWHLLKGLTIRTFFHHSFPIIFLLIGHISFRTAVFCFISVIDVAGCLFSLGLFLYHMSLILTNQTVFERSKGIQTYNLNDWKLNLRESLGDKWFLIWLSPFVSSPLPRDGIIFPTYDNFMKEAQKTK